MFVCRHKRSHLNDSRLSTFQGTRVLTGTAYDGHVQASLTVNGGWYRRSGLIHLEQEEVTEEEEVEEEEEDV